MDREAQRLLDQRESAIAAIHDSKAAEERKRAVRQKVLDLMGGLPEYDGPLNPRVTGRIEAPRYAVEKVIFESLPQYYVTANVWIPKAGGRHPGVLLPLGHWGEGKAATQIIAANLAMKGFVVLAYDPVGQGERQQSYDPRLKASLAGGGVDQHLLSGALSVMAGDSFGRYRIWDAKRALDYLVSRPDVNADRIGCTGCSGGGTVATYISALDPRIKVAAPACYLNSFRLLFAGPTGDSEQTWPGFLSAGLDLADYAELFAPKPYLVISTAGDFFPIEGARRFFEEARSWYRLYGAADHIDWAIGPGPHGTPREVRERLYEWFQRWLADGKGDSRENPVEVLPPHKLFATENGQVEGRELHFFLEERFEKKYAKSSAEDMAKAIRDVVRPRQDAPRVRVIESTPSQDYVTERLAIETEPGLEIEADYYAPRAAGNVPAVLMVDGVAAAAAELARGGSPVLVLRPRRSTSIGSARRPVAGDWITNTRAWLIGRNLPGMRALDILRGVEVLASRREVSQRPMVASARGVAGVWLLMAASLEPRISRIWLDRTPYSYRSAFQSTVHRDLHDALIPGFALHWDLADIRSSLKPGTVLWTDPTDWVEAVVPGLDGYAYRGFEEPDSVYWKRLLAGDVK